MARPRVSFGSMSPAFTFVLTMGVVNLFGDITYEGGGSINGTFMASLGASAVAGNWPMAAAFVLAERIGRAIRKPTVEAMLSYTTRELGTDWVYGLNTALDEIGATIGPLVIAAVLLDAALFGILLWGGGLCDPGHAAQGAHCHRLARRTT